MKDQSNNAEASSIARSLSMVIQPMSSCRNSPMRTHVCPQTPVAHEFHQNISAGETYRILGRREGYDVGARARVMTSNVLSRNASRSSSYGV